MRHILVRIKLLQESLKEKGVMNTEDAALPYLLTYVHGLQSVWWCVWQVQAHSIDFSGVTLSGTVPTDANTEAVWLLESLQHGIW